MRLVCEFLEVSTLLPTIFSSFFSLLRNMAAAAHSRLLRLGRQLQAASPSPASSLTRVKTLASVSSQDQFVGTGETSDVSCDMSPSSIGGPSQSPKESQRRVSRSAILARGGRDGVEASKDNSRLPTSLTSFKSNALSSLTEINASLSSLSSSKRDMTTTTHISSDDRGVHTPENRLKQQPSHQSSSPSVPECVNSANATSLHVQKSDGVPSISPSNSSFLFHPSSRSVALSSSGKSRTFFSPPFSSRSYSFSSSSSFLKKTATHSSLPGPGAVWSSDLLVEHCDESTTESGKKSGCVVLKLNRPEKLNALSLDVITALRWIMPTLEADPRCSLLCLAGEGPKAFCAGGDVRSLVRAPLLQVQQLFGQEYSLIYTISQMAKPYIALWNGISMGGGVGLSMCMKYRVCFDTTVWAMPETAIGLYPDVGAAYFLNRLPPHLPGVGFYIGLTGIHLKAADVMRTGLATHYVPIAKREELLQALRQEIFADLEKGAADGDSFCLETVKILRGRCPLSCAIWLDLYRRAMRRDEPVSEEGAVGEEEERKEGKRTQPLSLLEILREEYKLIQLLVYFHPENFNEGIRAVLIDKDRQPKWKPAKIEDLRWADISRFVNCQEDATGSLDFFVFP
ncbi:3-hydroxyisobutyryl- mitochondrial [Cystoisospora suis]|uniref:3-hydroxyisobutyryl-CoA hydrolase n=1 Tax=Cystoisospora suis TaxID=483139 RepID=A0A2C6KWS0_9APIC|nr:3-hydroxyisobutyryl- mitochondrial [Cystoisospora suis]